VVSNMEGQSLLPESHAIAQSYKRLYGSTNPSLQAIAGVNWIITAQTPFPRLRAENNLVIPDDKLPKPPVVDQPEEEEEEATTAYTYVCKNPIGTPFAYKQRAWGLSDATRYTTTNKSDTPQCTGDYTQAEFI